MMGVDISSGASLSLASSNRQSVDPVQVQPTAKNTAEPVNVIAKTADNTKETVTQIQEPQKQTIKVEQDNIMASFEYDQHLKQVIITLKNNNTGEVVQQFPSEKVLRILEGIMQSLQPVENTNIVDAKG